MKPCLTSVNVQGIFYETSLQTFVANDHCGRRSLVELGLSTYSRITINTSYGNSVRRETEAPSFITSEVLSTPPQPTTITQSARQLRYIGVRKISWLTSPHNAELYIYAISLDTAIPSSPGLAFYGAIRTRWCVIIAPYRGKAISTRRIVVRPRALQAFRTPAVTASAAAAAAAAATPPLCSA
ncbi:hypothetical protein M0802_001245 [Mischocyttarus mexicanus]|nr:hypothetical protein M0802_001245 [Mischocyttarus mexicanus]